ncbi:hypothetical protein HYR99_05600 [Candidatus Poribacteria bacterium]|nr:hypothetical protein [Candidatus Poribacteria bacterium]
MAIACTSNLEIIFRLLKKLKAVNESNDYGGLLAQEIRAPEPFLRSIPTLKKGAYRQPTPQVSARFQFAGRWINAGVGHTWLSVPDMEAAWEDKKILEQIRICQKYWQASAPQRFEWNRLSLFGIETEQYEETYLVWSEDESKEPEIYLYSGHEENRFKDLQDYLEFLVS